MNRWKIRSLVVWLKIDFLSVGEGAGSVDFHLHRFGNEKRDNAIDLWRAVKDKMTLIIAAMVGGDDAIIDTVMD